MLNVARDQSSIFSTGRKFCPDYGLLLELHALTLVARSYTLLLLYTDKETFTYQVLYDNNYYGAIGLRLRLGSPPKCNQLASVN